MRKWVFGGQPRKSQRQSSMDMLKTSWKKSHPTRRSKNSPSIQLRKICATWLDTIIFGKTVQTISAWRCTIKIQESEAKSRCTPSKSEDRSTKSENERSESKRTSRKRNRNNSHNEVNNIDFNNRYSSPLVKFSQVHASIRSEHFLHLESTVSKG